MPTIVYNLGDEHKRDRTFLYEGCRDIFTDGECYALAIALHQGLGWPIIGLMHGEVIRHAAVRSPDGKLHDIRGFITEEEFGRPYLAPPHELREVTPADLLAKRPISEYTIRRARRLAELIWPNLPWRDSAASRVVAFADELEALSRKHNLWIRGFAPACPPYLAEGDGTEGGYEVRPTPDGLTFTVDRYFA